jgi:uncharacterized repeat protein (TIGR01451 family)
MRVPVFRRFAGAIRMRPVLGAVLVAVLTATLMIATPRPEPVSAAPGEDQTPIDNPDLDVACGLDILVILDESGSIANAGATEDVRRAFRSFTQALKNTGSRMAVTEFSTVARLPLPGAAARNYTTVTDNSIANIFDPYINGDFNPNGSTHWEDAFRVGRYFLPRPSQETPHLTVFITDGDPNKIIRHDRVTFDPGNPVLAENEYELKVPLTENETVSADENPAKDRAVPNANALKTQGSHILTVAVGEGLQSQSSLNRIIAVSGPDVFPDTDPTFDISTTDVYREEDFALLEDALRDAAFQLCAPSVTVEKLVDHNPNPAAENLQPGQDWEMTAEVAPEPASWVLPPGSTGTTATGTTGADGFVNFQWNTSAPTDSTITVTEALQDGFVNDPAETACTFITPDDPDPAPLPGFDATIGGFSGTVPDSAIVTCRLVNRVVPNPAIDIEKDTNGVDADDPTGPFIPVGGDVIWSYRVQNIGDVPLTNVTVTDEPLGPIDCPPAINPLAVGEVVTCTAEGIAEVGQYANTGTVTARGAGDDVTDSDDSHYFGSAPGINVVKTTNGDDANNAPGPVVSIGDEVLWEYVVTNVGNAPISEVELTDNQPGVTPAFQGGDTNDDGVLDLTETWTYTAEGIAQPGQYENVADVTGTDTALGTVVQDSDPSHYFGENVDVTIVKSTNLEDANLPPGPFIPVGDTVVWRYLITNTGNVPLTWTVSDDQAPFIFCPRPILVPGASIACFSRDIAIDGQYENLGTVVGTSVLSGNTATDEDPSHYFGVRGGIELTKFTNDEDANEAPGPFLTPGSTVTWTYTVENTGNSELTNVTVIDFQISPAGEIICQLPSLAAGATDTCEATGTAEPDQYHNDAAAAGRDPAGALVQDTDPSHYFGDVPGINLQKYTNGDDADDAPGPFISVGAPIDWTYVVTNSGNSPLSDVVVVDDQGVEVTCPQATLTVGEEMTCTARGTSVIGQYANTGTATGTSPTGEVTDSDPSHYFGSVSDIDIEKFVNGQDADEAPGVEIPVGDPVVMTFEVTNPGNIPILGVDVIDDQGLDLTFLGGDTNGNDELDPGELWRYEANLGRATPGRFDNLGTVNGLDLLENPLTDDDPVFAFAAQPPEPGLVIEKSPDQATVPEGGSHTFTITVTNTGEVDLVNVEVVDEVVPECNRVIGDLPAGESVSYECTVEDVTERIRNIATVTGETPDGDVVRDRDDALVTVEEAPPPQQGPEEADCPDPDNPACPELPDTGGLPWWLVALGAGFVCLAGLVVLVSRLQRQDE